MSESRKRLELELLLSLIEMGMGGEQGVAAGKQRIGRTMLADLLGLLKVPDGEKRPSVACYCVEENVIAGLETSLATLPEELRSSVRRNSVRILPLVQVSFITACMSMLVDEACGHYTASDRSVDPQVTEWIRQHHERLAAALRMVGNERGGVM